MWIFRDKIRAWRGKGKTSEVSADSETPDPPMLDSVQRPAEMEDQRKAPTELPNGEASELSNHSSKDGVVELPGGMHSYELSGQRDG